MSDTNADDVLQTTLNPRDPNIEKEVLGVLQVAIAKSFADGKLRGLPDTFVAVLNAKRDNEDEEALLSAGIEDLEIFVFYLLAGMLPRFTDRIPFNKIFTSVLIGDAALAARMRTAPKVLEALRGPDVTDKEFADEFRRTYGRCRVHYNRIYMSKTMTDQMDVFVTVLISKYVQMAHADKQQRVQ
ncbi:hypothetical protein H0H81_003821 [Sphagnurus paluster]|uniref:Uncharacterized protein n=1 Tax=Sphagnurus paluster TaxID=117069 RepID=A0A9P7GTT4_9AGAR|nr:hypothetical protein H0H81_003821 [Sphagnurus paluster]